MNTERLTKLADVIEENPDHFKMSGWLDVQVLDFELERLVSLTDIRSALAYVDIEQCGTTACLCGWAALLWTADISGQEQSWTEVGANLLDLPVSDAETLFMQTEIDLDTAVAQLRHLAAGGAMDDRPR